MIPRRDVCVLRNVYLLSHEHVCQFTQTGIVICINRCRSSTTVIAVCTNGYNSLHKFISVCTRYSSLHKCIAVGKNRHNRWHERYRSREPYAIWLVTSLTLDETDVKMQRPVRDIDKLRNNIRNKNRTIMNGLRKSDEVINKNLLTNERYCLFQKICHKRVWKR